MNPITTPELRSALARLLAATANPQDMQAAINGAAEALGRPDEDRTDRLAGRLEDTLDAFLGRLEATGAVPRSVTLETMPRAGWPTYGTLFRWTYAATVELARLELAAANLRAEPGAWPAGQAWEGLGSTSRAAFMDLARDRVGIDRTAFLRVVRSGLVKLEDLWEGTPKIPKPRAGLVAWLEGEDTPRTVAKVVGSTVTFEDRTRLDWPDLVEDTGHPWPPFARPAELAELEASRAPAPALEDHDGLTAHLARVGPPVAVAARFLLGALEHGQDFPGALEADDQALQELGKRLAGTAAIEALDEIAALSGCATWDYPGQVVRDVKGIKARIATDLALELEDRARYALTLATGRGASVNREIAAELVVVAHGLHRAAGAQVGLGELQAQVGLQAVAETAKAEAEALARIMFPEAPTLPIGTVTWEDREGRSRATATLTGIRVTPAEKE